MGALLALTVLSGAVWLLDPAPPTGLIATPQIDGIYVQWDAGTDPEIADYRLHRTRQNEPIGFLIAGVPHPERAFFDSTAIGGVTYHYKVQARDIFAVLSAFSDSVAARFVDSSPPLPPDSLEAIPSQSGIFIRWARSAEVDIASYQVFRALPPEPFISLGSTEGPAYFDSTALVGQQYRFAVSAMDYSGNQGQPSASVSGILADGVAPGSVDSFEAVGIASGVFLSWKLPNDPDLAGVRIGRETRREASSELVNLPLGQESYLDTTGVERTFYIYRIAAFDHTGNRSKPVFAQALRPDLRAPATPESFRVSRNRGSILLEWDVGIESDISRYVVHTRSTFDSTLAQVSLPANSSNFRHIPFGPGLPTSYWLTATDSSGNESPPTPSFDTALVPADFQIERAARSLGEYSGARPDYRLISLPGQPNVPILETFSGIRRQDWEILRPGELTQFREALLRPGEAVWAYSESPWGVPRQTVAQVSTGALGYRYWLALLPGWNYLANPFDASLKWNHIMEANATSGRLFAYEGRYFESSIFHPHAGYLYYNRDGLDSLGVDYDVASGGAAESPEELALVTVSTGTWSRSVAIGLDPAAADALDPFDSFAPPPAFGRPDIALFDAAGAERFRTLVWKNPTKRDLILGISNAKGLAEIKIQGTLPGYRVYLEGASGRSFILSDHPTDLPITSDQAQARLSLRPASESETPLPIGGVGVESYPNPFREHITIEFGTEVDGRVRAEVFDLLGRSVHLITDRVFPAGSHRIVWRPNSTTVAGQYLIRLNSPRSARSIVAQRLR